MSRIQEKLIRKLAGFRYPELLADQASAVACLKDADSKIRTAALLACQLVWKCSARAEVVDACFELARGDPDERVRGYAIGVLGAAFQNTQDVKATQFLAVLFESIGLSVALRHKIYWAVREIQQGLSTKDRALQVAEGVKRSIQQQSINYSEVEARKVLSRLCRSEIDWDATSLFDEAFVRQFVPR